MYKDATFWVDGGCINGCPGDAVYYSVVEETRAGNRKFRTRQRRNNDYVTNNQAEYLAVMHGLIEAQKHYDPGSFVVIKSDSRLIINQLNGDWDVKNDTLRELWYDTIEILEDMRANDYGIRLIWVERSKVEDAVGH